MIYNQEQITTIRRLLLLLIYRQHHFIYVGYRRGLAPLCPIIPFNPSRALCCPSNSTSILLFFLPRHIHQCMEIAVGLCHFETSVFLFTFQSIFFCFDSKLLRASRMKDHLKRPYQRKPSKCSMIMLADNVTRLNWEDSLLYHCYVLYCVTKIVIYATCVSA